jgi:glycosyltransferase involved in cell wall biosynthesis
MDLGLVPFTVSPVTDRVSPIKLFDYWSLGKPVVSTSIYEIRKMGTAGVVFADTADELKKAIQMLGSDHQLMEYHSRAAQQAVKDYDWRQLGQRFLGLISRR